MRRSLTKNQREALYDAEVAKAQAARRGDFPICALCDNPIFPGRKWHDNHDKHLPHALGGERDGISHARCNLDHAHSHAYPVNTYKRRDPLDVETEAEMKILTAMFRARDDGTITSHFRAQNMTGDDVLPMLKKVRADLDTEIALVENCPAVRAKYADATT